MIYLALCKNIEQTKIVGLNIVYRVLKTLIIDLISVLNLFNRNFVVIFYYRWNYMIKNRKNYYTNSYIINT